MKSTLTLCLFLFTITALHAQFAYEIENSVPVDGLQYPFAGGVNSGQYNNIDLNNDGVLDLVVFDRTGGKILTFINSNGTWAYEPEYAYYFPAGVNSWMILRDFNCDGKQDIFTSDALGMKAYVNITEEGGPLQWRLFNSREPSPSPLLTKGFTANINLQMNSTDLPAIEDVDGDGDLDILVFRPSSNSTIEFHKNLSVENGGGCDSLQLERVSQQWGGLKECSCGTFVFNNDDCGVSGGREAHQGGKSMFLYDRDNDGDLDLVISEETCTTSYYLENVGNEEEASFQSVSADFPTAAEPVDDLIFPAVFRADVNMDGLEDFMVSSNAPTSSLGQVDFSQSNWWYKNTGTSYTLMQKDFLTDQMIDVTENASPAFFDEDGDGDLDMIIGQFLSQNGGTHAQLRLYENYGTVVAPAFRLKDEDYLGLSQSDVINIKPKTYDINNDGKLDLIFSATSLLTYSTNLFYAINTSSRGMSFSESAKQFFTMSEPGDYYENYEITDIDGDGQADLLIGKLTGKVEYYRNVGDADNPSFILEDDSFYGLDFSTSRINPAMEVADLNADGKQDLLLTDQRGTITIYSDFKSHLENPEEGIVEIMQPKDGDELTTYRFGSRLYPVAVNLFNENKPAIALGTGQGGVFIIRNVDTSAGHENVTDLDVFPNPLMGSRRYINVSSRYPGEGTVVNILGKIMSSSFSMAPQTKYSIDVSHLPNGVYIMMVKTGDKIMSKRFVIDH